MGRPLALVLAARFEEVIQGWIAILRSSTAGSVDARSVDDTHDLLEHGARMIFQLLAEDSQAPRASFLSSVAPSFARRGWQLSATQRALLSFKEAAIPVLAVEYGDDPRAILEASRVLDRTIHLLVAELADHYPLVIGQQRDAYLSALERRNRWLEQRIARDGLTDLFAHAPFVDRLREEIQRAGRYHRGLALVMLDLDQFKQLNDTRGHLAGDQALIAVARAIRRACRQSDIPARYGGDEFALLLPETTAADAWIVAQRIRAAVERLGIPTGQPGQSLTVSAGIAAFPADAADATELIEKADQSLYRAKRNGRNAGVRRMPVLGNISQDERPLTIAGG